MMFDQVNGAAVSLCNLFHNGHSQSVTLLISPGAIAYHKGIKDGIVDFRRDADAPVAYGENGFPIQVSRPQKISVPSGL